MHIEGTEGAPTNSQLLGTATGERARPSTTELRKQFSLSSSVGSVDSVTDLKLVESISNLKRCRQCEINCYYQKTVQPILKCCSH